MNSEGIMKLRDYEKSGKYVFHGSPVDIDILEPRQAFRYESGVKVPDGKPAVFASEKLNIAIFKSLINGALIEDNFELGFRISDGKEFYSCSIDPIGYLEGKEGRIYVLDKKNFTDFTDLECRCYETIEPIEVINVTIDDFKEKIGRILNMQASKQ